jgi:hypothetical protein
MVVLKLNLISPGHISISAVMRTINLTSDTLQWFIDWFPRMYDLSGNKIYEDTTVRLRFLEYNIIFCNL